MSGYRILGKCYFHLRTDRLLEENLFLLPKGKTGKLFIDELTKLFNAWIDHLPLKKITMKAVMIMPSFLLQKPLKESKSKDHLKALE